MAEDKKSILIYVDLIHTVEKLNDTDAGLLFKHLLRYVNDLNPESPSPLIDIVFEQIKQQLKRDLRKYEEAMEGKKKGAKLGNLKRWHPDLYKKVNEKLISIDQAMIIASDRSSSHSDKEGSQPIAEVAVKGNDSVTVSDNVTDTDIKKEKKKAFSFSSELKKLGVEPNHITEWLAVRRKRRATNSETAFNGFIREVEKSGLKVKEVVKKCVEKSWSGFDAKWVESDGMSSNVSIPTSPDSIWAAKNKDNTELMQNYWKSLRENGYIIKNINGHKKWVKENSN